MPATLSHTNPTSDLHCASLKLSHLPQMRLSILLTYLLGKSPLLMQAWRLGRSMAALASEALRPVWASVAAAGNALLWAVQPVLAGLAALHGMLQEFAAALMWGPMQLVAAVREHLGL